MIDVINQNCIEHNCFVRRSYNYVSKSPIYCNQHKKVGMVDVVNKRCLEEKCDTIAHIKKYKGYCLRCFIYKFPNEKVSRNYKVKELFMTDFIKEQFKNEVITFDKQTGGCSMRRPDVYIDKFTHVVIIECDENQHKDTSCENKRTMELFQDFCNRPIVFISVNQDGKKVLSSFKYHNTLGVPMIRDQKEWCGRLDVLKETINKHLITIPNKEITNEYLFYDNL